MPLIIVSFLGPTPSLSRHLSWIGLLLLSTHRLLRHSRWSISKILRRDSEVGKNLWLSRSRRRSRSLHSVFSVGSSSRTNILLKKHKSTNGSNISWNNWKRWRTLFWRVVMMHRKCWILRWTSWTLRKVRRWWNVSAINISKGVAGQWKSKRETTKKGRKGWGKSSVRMTSLPSMT